MSHPTRAQKLLSDAREGRPVQRVEIPRVACERCGREVFADADGGPRAHLRDTFPGEALHSEVVPTMTQCEE